MIMTELLLILLTTLFAVALFVGLGMMAWYFILMQLRKEAGPWVVTRVASDGSGVEFLYAELEPMAFLWTKNPSRADTFKTKKIAETVAKDHADVHPLSRYVGGVK
jgi:hypothetical protein